MYVSFSSLASLFDFLLSSCACCYQAVHAHADSQATYHKKAKNGEKGKRAPNLKKDTCTWCLFTFSFRFRCVHPKPQQTKCIQNTRRTPENAKLCKFPPKSPQVDFRNILASLWCTAPSFETLYFCSVFRRVKSGVQAYTLELPRMGLNCASVGMHTCAYAGCWAEIGPCKPKIAGNTVRQGYCYTCLAIWGGIPVGSLGHRSAGA